MSVIKVEYDGNFKILEVTEDDGSIYTLEGYCSQCGQCCINPKYNVGYNDASGRCSQLITETIDGSLLYRCQIYENRPVGCLLWPIGKVDIAVNTQCTYKFIKNI